MNKKPINPPRIDFCNPLVKGLIKVELFLKPRRRSWFSRKLYNWHSVVIRDVDGKTNVYLDNNLYLFYDYKLSWLNKLRLKLKPFRIITTKGSCLVNGRIIQVTS